MLLTELDRTVIVSIYVKGNRSKHAHLPIDFICKGFPSHLHGKVKRSVRKLRKRGFIYRKPHPSGDSYGLTDAGWKEVKELEKEY